MIDSIAEDSDGMPVELNDPVVIVLRMWIAVDGLIGW